MYDEKCQVHNAEKIESLQALRALAFIGIFLSHAKAAYKWPALGVSTFFVMSGFLMFIKYKNYKFENSVIENIKFSLNKIARLYPLHIIMMALTVIYSFILNLRNGLSAKYILDLLFKIAVNITLLQTWFPDRSISISLNGVAWFLSVMMFLYFIFPFLIGLIKNKKMSYLAFLSFLLLSTQIAICYVLLIGGGYK